MNIAAFNVGIATGSFIDGIASTYSAQAPMLVGLLPLALAGVLACRLQIRFSGSVQLSTAPH
jgi:predicted MFS family arabinose efflux permease